MDANYYLFLIKITEVSIIVMQISNLHRLIEPNYMYNCVDPPLVYAWNNQPIFAFLARGKNPRKYPPRHSHFVSYIQCMESRKRRNQDGPGRLVLSQ